MKTNFEMANACQILDGLSVVPSQVERLIELVRADERERVTNMLLYLHNKAAPYHNYYKHAAIELNREAGEGEKI